MKPRPSHTLATIVAKGAIRAERNPHISLLNAVALEMSTDHLCHATHIISMALDHNEQHHLRLQMNELCNHPEPIDHSAYSEGEPLDTLWQGLVGHYSRSRGQNAEATIHSGHLLSYILSQRNNHLGQLMARYGVRPSLVEMFNEALPAEEEYYGWMEQPVWH